MIKKFSKVFILLAALVILIGISSCDNSSDYNFGSSNTTESKDSKSKDIYLENAVIETDSFSLTLKSKYCSSYSPNYSLSIYFDLVNKEYITKKFTIKDATLT